MTIVPHAANIALMLLAAVAFVLVVCVFAWSLCRVAAKETPTPDRPCSNCGLPTGWTWFGRPLCPTCRKREIEEGS